MPEAIPSSIAMIKGSRTSAVSDGVVHPDVRIKTVPLLLVAKFVIDYSSNPWHTVSAEPLVTVSRQHKEPKWSSYSNGAVYSLAKLREGPSGTREKVGRKRDAGLVGISDRMGVERTGLAAHSRDLTERAVPDPRQMGRSVRLQGWGQTAECGVLMLERPSERPGMNHTGIQGPEGLLVLGKERAETEFGLLTNEMPPTTPRTAW